MAYEAVLKQIETSISTHMCNDQNIVALISTVPSHEYSSLATAIKSNITRVITKDSALHIAEWARVLFHVARRAENHVDRAYALWYGGIAHGLSMNAAESIRMFTHAANTAANVASTSDVTWLIPRIAFTQAYLYLGQGTYTDANMAVHAALIGFTQAQETQLTAYTHALSQKIDAQDARHASLNDHSAYTAMLAVLHTPQPVPKVRPEPLISRKSKATANLPTMIKSGGNNDDRNTPTTKHMIVQEGQTGFGYNTLFGEYILGASHIKISDPYIATFTQIRNLKEFLKTVSKYASHSDAITVVLTTKRSDTDEQVQFLIQVREEAKTLQIDFDWEWDDALHDRNIVIDHSRWKILLGRGLDIYQYFRPTKDDPRKYDLDRRSCKKFEITYLNDF
jgi:hypothetical protein